MSEQNRWSEDRTGGGWDRDTERYGRGYDDDQGFYGADRDRALYYGYNQPGRYAQSGGRASDRTLGEGAERYGVPSDYNFGGPDVRGSGRDRQAGGFGPDRYGQSRDSQDRGGRYGGYGPERYGQSSRDCDFGADRYQLGDGRRPQEDRSWWDQTRDQVSSWFGDNEALRRRQADDLRAGEHRGRGPKGYVRSDDRIREDVNDRLTDHGHLDATDIDVSVSGAEVTLNGTVHRREDKRRAEDIVEGVSGVKHVQNNLRIKDASSIGRTSSFGSTATGSTGAQSSNAQAANPQATGSQTKAN